MGVVGVKRDLEITKKILERHIKNGADCTDIAKFYDITNSAIHYYLRKYKLKTPKRRNSRVKIVIPQDEIDSMHRSMKQEWDEQFKEPLLTVSIEEDRTIVNRLGVR